MHKQLLCICKLNKPISLIDNNELLKIYKTLKLLNCCFHQLELEIWQVGDFQPNNVLNHCNYLSSYIGK